MTVLQTTKVTSLGRIYLGKKVMEFLNIRIGDHIQIFKNGDGEICIAKVTPPEEA